MYRLMRNVHLILGLASLLFLTAYLISSVRFAHGRWFSRGLVTTESQVQADSETAEAPRKLAAWLMAEHDMGGDLMRVQRKDDGGYSMTIRRIGTRYEIERSAGAKEVKVVTQRQGFWGMLASMHTAHGFWHDYWGHKLWGALALISSLALLLLGASGLYLWFKTYEERGIGAAMLVVGTAWAVTSLILVRQLG